MTLPPGTILQIMYVKERLREIPPSTFVEIGVVQAMTAASSANGSAKMVWLKRMSSSKWRRVASIS